MALIFPLLLIGAVYFLMLRPQQQRVARQRELVNSIQVGDEVVTAGGIVARVRWLDDDRVKLEVSPGVEITLLRGAVAQRLSPDVPEAESANGELGSGSVDEDPGF
jgi:preprotein translocase subunit YajC